MPNKLATKLQSLGQHASRLRRAVEAAPAKAAQLREAVVLTAGQLQQLRAEVQGGITDLRADTGDHLLASLAEIEAGRDTLRQAGFALEGVDLELGSSATQRLLLQLSKVETVPILTLKRLHAVNQGQPTLRGVLAALLRAAELSDHIQLSDLSYRQLTVVVGPIPTVRVGWRSAVPAEPSPAPSDADDEPPVLQEHPPSVLGLSPMTHRPAPSEPALRAVANPPALYPIEPPPPAPAPAPAPPLPPSSSSGTSVPTATAPISPAIPLTESRPSVTLTPSSTALGKDWRKGALDRFKKMPDLTHPD